MLPRALLHIPLLTLPQHIQQKTPLADDTPWHFTQHAAHCHPTPPHLYTPPHAATSYLHYYPSTAPLNVKLSVWRQRARSAGRCRRGDRLSLHCSLANDSVSETSLRMVAQLVRADYRCRHVPTAPAIAYELTHVQLAPLALPPISLLSSTSRVPAGGLNQAYDCRPAYHSRH